MKQISYRIFVRKYGNAVVLVFDKEFANSLKMKVGDCFIPATQKKHNLDCPNDEVFGDKELVLLFKRRAKNADLETIDFFNEDDYGN